jgi:hypothetical protein
MLHETGAAQVDIVAAFLCVDGLVDPFRMKAHDRGLSA